MQVEKTCVPSITVRVVSASAPPENPEREEHVLSTYLGSDASCVNGYKHPFLCDICLWKGEGMIFLASGRRHPKSRRPSTRDRCQVPHAIADTGVVTASQSSIADGESTRVTVSPGQESHPHCLSRLRWI